MRERTSANLFEIRLPFAIARIPNGGTIRRGQAEVSSSLALLSYVGTGSKKRRIGSAHPQLFKEKPPPIEGGNYRSDDG